MARAPATSRHATARSPFRWISRHPRRSDGRRLFSGKRIMRRWIAAMLLTGMAAHAAAQAPYDRIVDDAVARYRLQGIAVGVIENGKVTFTGTRGERLAGAGEPIDRQS